MLTQPLSGIERRITIRMLSYWEKMRKGRLMPLESDFKPEDLHDLWDSCFLVPLKNDGSPDFKHTYIGKAILEAYRHGLSEDDDQRLISPDISSFIYNHRRLLAAPKPLLEEGEFKNTLLGVVKYRQCLLPLGEDGRVYAILGGMHFKNFLPAPRKPKIMA